LCAADYHWDHHLFGQELTLAAAELIFLQVAELWRHAMAGDIRL
jgi:hypothetical protein